MVTIQAAPSALLFCNAALLGLRTFSITRLVSNRPSMPPLSSRRRRQPRSAMLPCPIEQSRVSVLRTGKETPGATHVLYWMSTSLRASDNAALSYAAHLATLMYLPLRAVVLLDPLGADGVPLPARQAKFLLESLVDLRTSLRDLDIPLSVVSLPSAHQDEEDPVPHAVAELCERNRAGALIADADYLKRGRRVRADVAKRLTCPVHIVEANVVVPVAQVTQKAEHAARTIRPKITRLVPDFLYVAPPPELSHQGDAQKQLELPDGCTFVDADAGVDELLDNWDGIDTDAPGVATLCGGEEAALNQLRHFIAERLPTYAADRNEPAKQLTSDLSPYLRFGNVSPVTITLAVNEAVRVQKALKASGADSFLEELIVRRELSVNACWFNEGYDDFETAVPAFAQRTLVDHEGDERQHIYTYEELECGATHDDFWNAAQLEMVARGKMHGYMRMYWAKQVIGWVESPRDAWAYTLKLNNRWGLDATDPNSYVGVNWCYGLHDQGWAERAVWGKVRFMNEAGLRRKFNMPAYVAMVNRTVLEHGLPAQIVAARKRHGKGITIESGTQATLTKPTRKKRGAVKPSGL